MDIYFYWSEIKYILVPVRKEVESNWNVMARGDARGGKWGETGEWSG